MKMRESKVLDKLRRGEVVSSFKINSSDSRIVEIAAITGFDCIWLDMEHVPNDYTIIEKQILAAKAHGVDTLVRVSRGGYSDYIRPLEADATGIMVPHIMNLEDAQRVVKMTRFHPIGRRAVDSGNADGAYCNIDFAQYIKESNKKRFLSIQIEDPEALEHIDEIAALDGIDMLFFGPGDFSHAIGVAGQWDHPEILRVKSLVAEKALKYGKYAGTVGSIDNMDELIELGYRFINVSSDVTCLSTCCSKIVSRFTENAAKYDRSENDVKSKKD